MGTNQDNKQTNFEEYLDYLNSVFTLISNIYSDGPKQEQIDAIKKDFYFIKNEEKTDFNDLLNTARKYVLSENRMKTDFQIEEARENNRQLTSYFNDLYYKFVNPLSSFKELEDRNSYLTQEVLKNK
jgi:rhamnogalacturonyl hydrolase YesR